MPVTDRPRPRYPGATQTPWIWQAPCVTAPISALKTTSPSSAKRANERPAPTSSATRAW